MRLQLNVLTARAHPPLACVDEKLLDRVLHTAFAEVVSHLKCTNSVYFVLYYAACRPHYSCVFIFLIYSVGQIDPQSYRAPMLSEFSLVFLQTLRNCADFRHVNEQAQYAAYLPHCHSTVLFECQLTSRICYYGRSPLTVISLLITSIQQPSIQCILDTLDQRRMAFLAFNRQFTCLFSVGDLNAERIFFSFLSLGDFRSPFIIRASCDYRPPTTDNNYRLPITIALASNFN